MNKSAESSLFASPVLWQVARKKQEKKTRTAERRMYCCVRAHGPTYRYRRVAEPPPCGRMSCVLRECFSVLQPASMVSLLLPPALQVGFMICYTLPSLFYLKIRWHKSFNIRKVRWWHRSCRTLRRVPSGGGKQSSG